MQTGRAQRFFCCLTKTTSLPTVRLDSDKSHLTLIKQKHVTVLISMQTKTPETNLLSNHRLHMRNVLHMISTFPCVPRRQLFAFHIENYI